MFPRGRELLNNSLLNKGTAFTEAERDALGLRGLLPPRIFSIDEQVKRTLGNFRRKTDPLEKYIFLTTLQNRNETLFYRLVQEHAEEMIPIIYTPTVGQACLEYGAIFRRSRGLYISYRERGRIAEILRNWHAIDVRMIVVTDGERILGLGDLGACGMGIPVGKLSLYTACAGLHPYYTLPITLDVGTDNAKLLEDPLYIGINQKRVRGAEYDAFIKEFVDAVCSVYPRCLIQWEDFGNTNAFRVLNTYRSKVCSFNDDIQGTASVALAGVIAGLRLTGGKLSEQKIVFQGAGEAGTGIADLFVEAAMQEGLTKEQARARCWFVDSQGLVVKNRPGKLAEHKVSFAHDRAFIPTLKEAVETLRPTIIVGVSGTPHAFTKDIVESMAKINKRPIIFALSNPTSKAECTAEEAYAWSDGRAIFASGSPFPPVTYKGTTFVPGQGNNVYVFPGVGLGALVCECTQITDGMFLKAAQTLASIVEKEDLSIGRIFPSLQKIREVSIKIAVAVVEEAYREGFARAKRPADIEADIRSRVFVPEYRDYV
ncbi:MAG: NAD-dependent malic enzyme [Opitutaceae bacterium]|jgi:malate dehydrogenase (oxaloacetate-decarboxylating)(NADP+)